MAEDKVIEFDVLPLYVALARGASSTDLAVQLLVAEIGRQIVERLEKEAQGGHTAAWHTGINHGRRVVAEMTGLA